MEKPRLALVSRNKSAYSETFIDAHRQFLDADVFYYYLSSNRKYPINNDLEPEIKYQMSDILRKMINNPISSFMSFKSNDMLNKFFEIMVEKSFRRNGIEVVLAEYGTTGALLVPLCQRLKLPLIVHFHGFDASKTNVISKNKLSYERMFEYASYIIVVSKVMYSALVSLGVDQKKLILNHYGPRDSFFNVKRSEIPTQTFFSIGRFVEKKAPYLTILAFSKVLDQFPDAILKMAGDGPLLPICKNLVGALDISGNVQFTGILERTSVEVELASCLAYVQHSIMASDGDMEGTPLAILEASAAGVPVISTYHAGIPDVIISGVTGILVEEQDVKHMTEAMIELLKFPDLAEKMGKAGRMNIQENFPLKKHLSIIDELIEKVY